MNGKSLAVPFPDTIMLTKNKFKDNLGYLLRVVLNTALIGELVVMFANVVSRALFSTSIVWSQEVGQLALMIITFIGGAVAYPRGEHMAIKAITDRLPQRLRVGSEALVNWIVFLVSILVGVVAIQMAMVHWKQTSMILGIKEAWFVLPMIVGMFLLAYFALDRLLYLPRRTILIVGGIVITLGAIISLTNPMWSAIIDDSNVLGITLTIFFVFLLLGVPIGFVLESATVLYLYLNNSINIEVPLTAIPLQMQQGMSSFILLAIPFFIMAGYIMTEGGLSRRLTESVMSIVGRARGGLLQVIVVVMYIVSGLSGSKIADVAVVGATMNKMLKERGYDAGESAAVLAAAAVMGETVPPSIAMLVLGSITTLSIGTLFIAGLVPAVVMAVCIMVLIAIRARMTGMPVEKGAALGEVLRKTVIAIPALLAPIILIGGIVSGFATPTEVSSTAVIYSLILSIVFYREINMAKLWNLLSETAAKTGMVLFIIGAASAFSWTLTMAQVPHKIAQLLTSMGGSSVVFLLTTIVILIIMGAMLEGLPAILIFGPLLLPIAPQFGIDPLQFGIVCILAMGLGSFLPPVGVGSYVCCSVCETTIEATTRKMLPYLVFILIGILLIAFVPWFTLVLPRALHMIK